MAYGLWRELGLLGGVSGGSAAPSSGTSFPQPRSLAARGVIEYLHDDGTRQQAVAYLSQRSVVQVSRSCGSVLWEATLPVFVRCCCDEDYPQ